MIANPTAISTVFVSAENTVNCEHTLNQAKQMDTHSTETYEVAALNSSRGARDVGTRNGEGVGMERGHEVYRAPSDLSGGRCAVLWERRTVRKVSWRRTACQTLRRSCLAKALALGVTGEGRWEFVSDVTPSGWVVGRERLERETIPILGSRCRPIA